ncbi:MAG: SDR family oxidoreductase [Lachnospiraceae bacterium]|nr:SDR family oxidoreductase [Lachnospiraceae bacterium]
MKYFIFGASGYIGLYLYHRLKSDGYNVVGTSRNTVDDKLLFYDIENSNIDGFLKIADRNEKKTAIICIAESNIDRCYEYHDEAYVINVVKTKQLIHTLLENGFQVIYFSSDNVFDGVSGNYTEESLTNPINEYGSMKAQMEQYLLQYEPKVCIMRISKVVSMKKEKQNVFTQWLEQIENGFIRCIKGSRLSFVCIEDIYQACLIAAEKKMYGLYNIAGDKAYSRAELAVEFYRKLGVTDIDIRECDLQEFDFKDKRPLNISMSNQKFKNETGYEFMKMGVVIEKFFNDESYG